MKKILLSIILSLFIIPLFAQTFSLGILTGPSISNGFGSEAQNINQYMNMRSQPFFGVQMGFIARYETKGFFKPQLEFLHSPEGNNLYISYNISTNPNEERLTQYKRTYFRVNMIPNFGGAFKNHPRWRFIGGIGLSTGFLLNQYPYIEYPREITYANNQLDVSILFSATLSWRLGIGWLEFNPRYRHSLMESFNNPNYNIPEKFNKSIEFNISFIIPIKLNTDPLN